LDQILLPLADAFEGGNRTFRTFTPKSPEEFETLRELLAILIAEESLAEPNKAKDYDFTPAGYLKYKPRIDALWALG
jgi:hypothetical protein